MNKPKITIESFGVGRATNEEKQKNRARRELLMSIGMFPTHFDSGSISGSEKKLSNTRFSTMYKDRKDFDADRYTILDCIDKGIEIPQDIYNKVTHTVKELDLKFGD